jgi:hypothetical protein
MTSALSSQAQSIDATATAPAVETQDTSDTSTGTYYPSSRVPATISVEMLKLNSDCSMSSSQPTPIPIHTYATPYYLLRVATNEVAILHLNEVGMRAFMALALNFAWIHKTKGGAYDVDNSTRYQCFRPHSAVESRWHDWMQTVLRHRLANRDGSLVFTSYRGYGNGVEACSDPKYPPGGGTANQNILAGLSDPSSKCGTHFTDWRKLATYFYAHARVVTGQVPAHPQTSFTVNKGSSITFTFKSLWSVPGTRMGWRYLLQRYNASTGHWAKIKYVVENSTNGSIQQSYTYTGGAGKCQKYRVFAGNPVGWSKASSYNSGQQICD